MRIASGTDALHAVLSHVAAAADNRPDGACPLHASALSTAADTLDLPEQEAAGEPDSSFTCRLILLPAHRLTALRRARNALARAITADDDAEDLLWPR